MTHQRKKSNIILVLATFFASVTSFATSLVPADTFNLLAPTVFGAHNLENLPSGSIVFDSEDQRFKGKVGSVWQSLSRSSIYLNVTTTSSTSYTMTASDEAVITTSGSATTVTLPAASNFKDGRLLHVISDGAGVVTINSNSTIPDTISDGSATTMVLQDKGEAVTFLLSGTNWYIVDRKFSGQWINDSSCANFAPTNFGTVTTMDCRYRRVGDSAEVEMSWTNAAVSASPASVTLSSAFAVDTSKMTSTANVTILGYGNSLQTGPDLLNGNRRTFYAFYDGSTNNQIFFGAEAVSSAYAKANSNSFSVGNKSTIRFTYPVSNWKF